MKKFNHWQLAYRTDKSEKFIQLPNPPFAWAADPFLVEYRGKIYLFAELYLYNSERNGVIGYCEYQNGMFSEWTVTMDRHWHLSYPNVFVYKNELYMCPESYQRGDVSIYKLISFPDQWQRVVTLLDNVKCVDTTFLQYGEEYFFYTFEPGFFEYGGQLILYRLKDGKVDEKKFITDDKSFARPGGNVIQKNGRYIRVSQDCSTGYGCGLVFSEIDSVWPNYEEHIVKRITPNDIQGEWNEKIIGVHTYNVLNGIEVIDLKFQCFSWREYIARKRVRKVFLNKY